MYLSGEDKLKKRIQSESKIPQFYEGRGMKVPLVTWILPETGRSIPEQGEARVKLRGGLKRFYGQVFF